SPERPNETCVFFLCSLTLTLVDGSLLRKSGDLCKAILAMIVIAGRMPQPFDLLFRHSQFQLADTVHGGRCRFGLQPQVLLRLLLAKRLNQRGMKRADQAISFTDPTMTTEKQTLTNRRMQRQARRTQNSSGAR